MYSYDRQQYTASTELHCAENITYIKRRLFVSHKYGTFLIQNVHFFKPSTRKKRKVTQSSKPDDHIEETFDLALICLQADHFPLNSTLDSVVGVAKPSWLRTYKH